MLLCLPGEMVYMFIECVVWDGKKERQEQRTAHIRHPTGHVFIYSFFMRSKNALAKHKCIYTIRFPFYDH